MTERDTENAVLLALIVLFLWRQTHSEVLFDYGSGPQPPVMDPYDPTAPQGPQPLIPDPWEYSQRLIPGDTPIYKNPPWGEDWWSGL